MHSISRVSVIRRAASVPLFKRGTRNKLTLPSPTNTLTPDCNQPVLSNESNASAALPIQAQLQTRNYSAGLDPSSKKDYDAYVQEWSTHFATCADDFELERGLNQIFAQDWAPSVELVGEALKAARRMDTFATTVRILEALEHKVHKKEQYQQYLKVLEPLMSELGVVDKHALGDFKAVRQKVKNTF
ncbi:cytochrome c oxidase, subunit VA/VI [Chytriomyces cf. hyalinus JEL632]|nr:cytochrome c oxidase, subunit VA/VI [Chytriomyces cf. hyalinus JEL632]